MKFQCVIWCSFSLILFITACSSHKNDSNNIGEPNNTILEAGILESGKSYSMKIDSIGDVDWFGIPVEEPGYINIATKSAPDNLNLRVQFAYKQEWEKEKQKWLTNELTIPTTITVSQTDTLYFVISDRYHQNYSQDPIEFKVDFIEEFDKYEPNDEPENAHEVKSGEVIQSVFFPATDKDWFKIQVDSSGYLMLSTQKIPESISLRTRFATRESDFSEIDYISSKEDIPFGIQVSPGMYYFELSDRYHANQSREMTEWKVDFISEMDPTEPNNNFDEAFSVSVGDTVQAAIFPLGDKDVFVLNPVETETVRIGAKAPKNLDLYVCLYKENDFEIEKVSGWEPLPAKFDLEADNKYYIELIDRYNANYSRDVFDLLLLGMGEIRE